jgi:hypothetical protein
MKTISFLYIIGLSLVLFSCGLFRSTKVTNNYATTTEQIFNLEQGMTLPEVSTTLKSEPKDVYANIETKTKIVVYKYRLNYQIVPLKAKNDEQYLRGGQSVYKDEGNLYVVFSSDKNEMLYFITDNGRKMGKRELNEALKIKLNTTK